VCGVCGVWCVCMCVCDVGEVGNERGVRIEETGYRRQEIIDRD